MENKNFLSAKNVTSLPSAFLQYPEGSAVLCSPFSFGDLSRFNNSNMTEVQFFEFVLEGIETKGFDKYDLTYYDVVYLALLRKMNSLGSTQVTLTSICDHCGHINTNHMDTQFFYDFVDLEIEEMPLTLELNSGELELKFITIRDWMELANKDMLDDSLNLYAKSVANRIFDEAYQTIYNATGQDIEVLNLADKMLYHGLKPLSLVCESCFNGYHANLSSEDVNSIIRPFRGEEESVRCKIHFGKKAHS